MLSLVNLIVGVGAISLQIVCVVILALLIMRVRQNRFLDFIKRNFLLLGFLISLVATLTSLYYSDVIGFLPCHLCWLQRIAIYPQVFLFGIAYWKKDRGIVSYALPILLAGVLVSIYHNYIYYFTEYAGPCDSSGVSCVQHLVSEFNGYISIPMLALSAFVALITMLLVVKFYRRGELN